MASEKKFEPLFSVPCGLQPALSSGDIGSELRELFEQKAKELNIKIESMEIMPDTSTCPSWHPLPSPHN